MRVLLDKMPFTQGQISDIREIVNTTVDTVISALKDDMAANIVQQILDRINFVDVEKRVSEHDKIIEKLEGENGELRSRGLVLEARIDSMEQYSRRRNVRIYNVPEEGKEDVSGKVVNLLKEKMDVDISAEEIESAYRIGKKGSNVRAVMVKFKSIRPKNLVVKKRRLLRGSGVVIAEDLTASRHRLLKEAVERLGKHCVWALDGHIYCRINDTKRRINSAQQLHELAK